MNRQEYNDLLYSSPYYSNSLAHHGILGQKWGVRRFQNPDGSLTPAGKKRYLNSDGSFKSESKFQTNRTKNKLEKYDREMRKARDKGDRKKFDKLLNKYNELDSEDDIRAFRKPGIDWEKYDEYQKQQYQKSLEKERKIQEHYTEIKDIIESDNRIDPEKQNYKAMSKDKRIDITKKAYKAEPLFDTAGDEREVDDGDAFWFFCEDQTIGCGAVAAMLYDGVPVSKVKNLIKAANRSFSNSEVEDKIRDTYGEKYGELLWELGEGSYSSNLEDFADKFDKVLHE